MDDVERSGSEAGSEAEEVAAPTPLPTPDLDACLSVTKDGGVLKLVVAEGYGEVAPKFARCLVHYTGRIAADGEMFMDSKAESNSGEPAQAVAGRGFEGRESGLSLALATMRAGEKAMVYVEDPKYGFGERGSFSFPAVPPSAKLVYEIEMVQWEPADEGARDDDRGGLLYEERLERAEMRRTEGNELFSKGQPKEALGKYAVALSYMDEDFLMQCEGTYLDKAHDVKLPVHLNMAAAQLQLGDYHTAIYNCAEALNLDPGNSKALYRRARAKHLLGQTEGALKDLDAALKRSPGDGALLKERQAVVATLKSERSAQAALYKGRLPPAASPADSAADTAAAPTDGRTASGSAARADPGPAAAEPPLVRRRAAAGGGGARDAAADDGRGGGTAARGDEQARAPWAMAAQLAHLLRRVVEGLWACVARLLGVHVRA
ncbi:hypothetical protein FOA52_009566 [Chlamydomonas sp. UWO 241]|nr:hypothetical protein FOA52_009566 [Chlamydomonas sp. UWO 241]